MAECSGWLYAIRTRDDYYMIHPILFATAV